MLRNLSMIVILTALLSGCSIFSDESERVQVAPLDDPTMTTIVSATAESSPSPMIATPSSEPDASATVRATPGLSGEAAARLAYFHIAPTDGEPASTLAEHAEFITLTSGDEAYRTQLRAAGYTGTVLQFLVAAEVNGPGPYRDATGACDEGFKPLRNGIARQPGEFCRDIHANEDWFLHNGAGDRLYSVVGATGVWYHMNPASDGWRTYALGHMLKDVTGASALGYDGIFLDNVEVSPIRAQTMMDNSDGTIAEFTDELEFVDAWITYLSEISSRLRPHGQLWANMVSDTNDGDSWVAYLPFLDGVMSPAFATGYHGLGVGKWMNGIQQVEKALASGVGVVAVGIGSRENEELQQFSFASYLLVTDAERSFFRYVSNESSVGLSSFWLYPNYALKLGRPLGERFRVGLDWRRDFQCGYVTVQPAQQTAEIIQTSTCP